MQLLNVLPAWHAFGIAFVVFAAIVVFVALLGVTLWIGAYRRETSEVNAGMAPGYSLWSLWTVTNAFAFPLAYTAGFLLPLSLGHQRMNHMVLSAVSGCLIGLPQWLSLRRRTHVSIGWAIGTVAGFGLAASVGGTLGLAETRDWPLTGAAVGLAQWLLIRKRPRAAYWILVNLLAFTLASLILPRLLGGVIIGAITGTTLVWLLRERPSSIGDVVREVVLHIEAGLAATVGRWWT